MTLARQERHKARGQISLFEPTTAEKTLVDQATLLLETATEMFGLRAKGILSTAYMLPDPQDFLCRKAEEFR